MPCDAYSEKESSLGFGRDDGASLAGKESAIVLSSIFSRFAFELAGSTTRSSGSLPRFFAAGFSGGAAFLCTTSPTPVLVIMSIQSDAPTSMGSGGRDSPISIWTNENIEVGHGPDGAVAERLGSRPLQAHRWTLHIGFCARPTFILPPSGKTIRKDLRDLSALLLDMGIVVFFVKDGLGVY